MAGWDEVPRCSRPVRLWAGVAFTGVHGEVRRAKGSATGKGVPGGAAGHVHGSCDGGKRGGLEFAGGRLLRGLQGHLSVSKRGLPLCASVAICQVLVKACPPREPNRQAKPTNRRSPCLANKDRKGTRAHHLLSAYGNLRCFHALHSQVSTDRAYLSKVAAKERSRYDLGGGGGAGPSGPGLGGEDFAPFMGASGGSGSQQG